MRLDARRSFAGCCYLSPIFPKFARIRIHNVQPSRKANGYPFNSFSDGPNWTRAFHHILFLNPSTRKKKRKKPFCALSRTPFLSALFYYVSRSLIPYTSWPLVYFSAVCRYKGEESGTEKILFGRMIIVIKKLRERWWKSVSLPPWWGGIPLLLSYRNFLPWGRSDWMAFFCGERLIWVRAREFEDRSTIEGC